MTNCSLVKLKPSENRITIRRWASIGDAVAATVVADKLIERGFDVTFQCHPAVHSAIRRHPKISAVTEGTTPANVNLDNTYEKHQLRRRLHFSQIFMEAANEQLAPFNIDLGPALNCKPTLRLTPGERAAAKIKFKEYDRPWVFVCPRSDTYACRQVPDGIWKEASSRIQGTKFWLGRHPAPSGFVDLKCQHLDNVIVWLSAADLLVTVDTGPMHIAAAMGIPVLAISQSSSPELHLSDQVDFMSIAPKLDCLNCQQNICPIPGRKDNPPCQDIDPEFIASWANARLRSNFTEGVSAIVPIYRPEVATLNRCLSAILPQVQEIIVTSEVNSVIPNGALTDGKIRYVRKGLAGIGYGRNANHGARHSTGKYLLFLNDDCFLNPDAVDKMRDCMSEDTGMVCPLLRYEDGRIWHAGKRRGIGQRGWGHIDLGARNCSIRQVTEMENVAGTAVLVRREAHFKAGCFDEDFFVYAEDDSHALAIRRAGYKILFTPFAEGIHMEHQSTNKLGNVMDRVNRSNALFAKKWGAYLDHNLNNPGIGDFDY